jgi:hypothetical protein
VQEDDRSQAFGLTVHELKNLLGGWGYEHALADEMYPNAYTQMVIVKTALLAAGRAGITIRVPVPAREHKH